MNARNCGLSLRTLSVSKPKHFWPAVLLLLYGSWSCLVPQVVYVPNSNDDTISTFIINTDAGTLTEILPRLARPGRPVALVADPRGKFVYAAISCCPTGGVVAYSINAATGALTQLPGSLPAAQQAPGPIGLSMDPAGKFLYVANQSGNNVFAYSINASTGALSPVPGSPFGAGRGPSGVIVDATGKFVYVTNQGSNNVWTYAIDSATGALAPVAGSPFATGTGPSRLTEDAAGKFLYVTNQGSNNVSAYTIDSATGALTPVPGSPFAAGTGPTAAAVDLAGKFAYVSNGDMGNLSAYTINSATGALTPLPGSPFLTERGPFGVVLDPAGKFLYVPNLLGNNVSAYAIDAGTGALTPLPGAPFAAGNGPQRPAVVQLSPPILPPVVVKSVLNAAGYALPGLPNHGIAQGSMFVIFGQNLGPAALQQVTTLPLQTRLGPTSVSVTVGGVTTSAIMVYTYVTQVAAILPSTTPLGDGTLTVTYSDRTSVAAPIHVVSGSLGIFTRNQGGSGPAIVQNYNSPSDQPVNGLTEAAHPGQTMILWGTGLGPVSFNETQPPQVQNVRNDVEVWVGNKRTNVSYSGRSPQFPGIDQINFTLPADVPQGCYVPLAVKLATPPVMSNFTTLAITSQGKVCSDPNGLSSKDLAPFQTGGTLKIGWLQLLRANISATIPGLGSGTGLADSGWGSFFSWNAATGASDQGLDMFTGRGTSLGGCSVHTFRPGGPGFVPWRASGLGAGPVLTVTGPKGSGQLLRSRPGLYEAHKALGAAAPPGISDSPLPPPFFEPGTISVENGSGGVFVGPFKAALTIPASSTPLNWTNLDAISASGIDRSADLTFTWTGGDATGEYVVIGGAVFLPDLMRTMQVVSAFLCTQTVTAGQFTVPSAVLSALPASTPDTLSGLLMVGRAPLLADSMKFTAPGLDIGYLTYAVFNATTAIFR